MAKRIRLSGVERMLLLNRLIRPARCETVSETEQQRTVYRKARLRILERERHEQLEEKLLSALRADGVTQVQAVKWQEEFNRQVDTDFGREICFEQDEIEWLLKQLGERYAENKKLKGDPELAARHPGLGWQGGPYMTPLALKLDRLRTGASGDVLYDEDDAADDAADSGEAGKGAGT
jgi:hypothetical protein